MKCPICKTEMKVETYYGDGNGIIEEDYIMCPNKHYSYMYSYGMTYVLVYDKEFKWYYNIKVKSLNKISNNIYNFIQWKQKQENDEQSNNKSNR